jgi:hypothetical protein
VALLPVVASNKMIGGSVRLHAGEELSVEAGIVVAI